ncbi:MAG: hypothetical protein QM731_03465 [Chitinophagaceae bacterium]
MTQQYHYETVSQALEELRRKGYVTDLNNEPEHITGLPDEETSKDFKIVDIYRYEGESDPGDEAIVYAIEFASGVKGVLVTGDGLSSETADNAILKKLMQQH